MSLTIMDTLEGQDNDVIIEVCIKQLCQIVIVPNNRKNNFQPLKITANKPIKSFISNKNNASEAALHMLS